MSAIQWAARVVFWSALLALLYAYVGYPAFLVVLGRLRPRPVHVGSSHIRLSLVVAVHNEESGIEERLENALGTECPTGTLEIIVASDGSTDRTEAIVRRFAGRGVRLLALPRCGKIAALSAAVRRSTGDVLVFSDANSLFEAGTLMALSRSFRDPSVGGVVGHTGYRLSGTFESSGLGESLYWSYDTWLKALESRVGSVVSAHGGLYAIRRDLYAAPPDGCVTDDFWISTGVVAAGHRLVFEPEARAWERPAPRSAQEFERRVRLTTRGLHALWARRGLLDPGLYGWYALFLFSRKVLRRIQPISLLALLATSFVLAPLSPVYAAALLAQAAFYSFALLGTLLRARPLGRRKLLYVPFYYCLANAASLVAVLKFLRGDRIDRWVPRREVLEA